MILTIMNKTQFENITLLPIPHITINDLTNQTNRTLIYGYTCERHTFHLYLKNKMFYCIYYDTNHIILHRIIGESIDPANCIPNKRVYPESCDYEFAQLLKLRGYALPYTTYNEQRAKILKKKKYHGLTKQT